MGRKPPPEGAFTCFAACSKLRFSICFVCLLSFYSYYTRFATLFPSSILFFFNCQLFCFISFFFLRLLPFITTFIFICVSFLFSRLSHAHVKYCNLSLVFGLFTKEKSHQVSYDFHDGPICRGMCLHERNRD